MSILRPLEIIISHSPELAAAGLDPHEFSLAVAAFPKCRVLLLDPALPEAEQEDRLRKFLGKGHRRPVVLAGLDPEQRAAIALEILRRTLRVIPNACPWWISRPRWSSGTKKASASKGWKSSVWPRPMSPGLSPSLARACRREPGCWSGATPLPL